MPLTTFRVRELKSIGKFSYFNSVALLHHHYKLQLTVKEIGRQSVEAFLQITTVYVLFEILFVELLC